MTIAEATIPSTRPARDEIVRCITAPTPASPSCHETDADASSRDERDLGSHSRCRASKHPRERDEVQDCEGIHRGERDEAPVDRERPSRRGSEPAEASGTLSEVVNCRSADADHHDPGHRERPHAPRIDEWRYLAADRDGGSAVRQVHRTHRACASGRRSEARAASPVAKAASRLPPTASRSRVPRRRRQVPGR